MHLLLGAFPPELGPLLAHPPAGWRAACTGVGALQAAAATARLVAEQRPRSVLFLGTCGHLDHRLALGELIWAQAAVASSLGERRGESYRPDLEPVRWEATLPNPGLKTHTVVVPPAITRTVEGAALLAGLGAAEHLELTGVYAACHLAGIKVGAALAVVNAVGPEAQTQWKAHHREGSERLVQWILASGCLG